MTTRLLQILLIGLLISCSLSPVKDRQSSRVIYSFERDSLVTEESYKLHILNDDTIWVYRYINTSDSRKNMTFRFNTKTGVLKFGPFDFKKAERNFFSNRKLSSTNFDLYELKVPVIDGNGPMLFNKEYGVLNVDNTSWTYQYLLLPERQESLELSEQILKKLKE